MVHSLLRKGAVACRVKEGDCPYCPPEYAQSHEVFRKYKQHESCQDANLIVCKSCAAQSLISLSLHTFEGGFEIWCMDAGVVNNTVRPFLAEQQNLTPCLRAMWLCQLSNLDSAIYSVGTAFKQCDLEGSTTPQICCPPARLCQGLALTLADTLQADLGYDNWQMKGMLKFELGNTCWTQ